MIYSDKLRHFPQFDGPAPGISAEKAAQSAEIKRQMDEWEALHGKVQTAPIRPVERLKRLTKDQTREAMRDKSFAQQVRRHQRQWVKGQDVR